MRDIKKLFVILTVFCLFSSFVLAKDKEEEEIRGLLGEAYMMIGEHDRAEEQFQEILKESPDNVKARENLADVLSWQKKYSDSIREYEKVLKLEPDNLKVKKKLAAVYSWRKDYRKAENLYKEIIGKDPDNIEVLTSLGEVLIWDRKYAEAVRYLELTLLKKKDNDTMMLYAEALLFSGDYESAEEIFTGLLQEDPLNLKVKVYLADIYAYTNRYDKAIALYKDVLRDSDDRKVKEQLAAVLSWDKRYAESLKLYNEILDEKEDKEVRLQKARVLGWNRKYEESLREYRNILSGNYDELVDLEMKAKKAYWDNRPQRAISYFSELIDKDPYNVEAMFDLSQVYSSRFMWKDAIGEYKRILAVYPLHTRARKGLKKVNIISKCFSLRTGYEFFEAESSERDVDIRRHSFLNRFGFPVNYNASVNIDYRLTDRSFSDFSDVTENEARLGLSYRDAPEWWINGFYDFVAYNKGIKEMHVFGADVNKKVFDVGVVCFSFERERLENTSEVIRESYYRDNYEGRLDVDINRRLKIGCDYLYAYYSDGNYNNEPGLDVFYRLSFEPRSFTIRYRYFFRDFDRDAREYFSPKNFSTHSVTVNWRHFLNKEEIFFGADDIYYDLEYKVGVDSEDIVSHNLSAGFNWDINERLNFNIQGSVTNTSCDIYKDKRLIALMEYCF